MTWRRAGFACIGVAASLLGACARRDRGVGHEPKATQAGTPADSARTREESTRARINATLEPGALATVAAAPVLTFTGPGGRPFEVTIRTSDPAEALARRFGTITMRNSLRTRAPDVGQYPCTSCHLGRRMILADKRIPDAHQNIKPNHPARVGGACSICHSADNVELLALKSGEHVTLDHTYRLCAQCHFAEAQAWAGGGHGKRLDGWQGRRVVMGCADCHDPHAPAIGSRTPFRAPRIARIRGHDQ